MSLIKLISDVILACCVLHNVCLQGYNEDNRDFIIEGAEDIPKEVLENNEINIGDARNYPAGLAKRDYLCHRIV